MSPKNIPIFINRIRYEIENEVQTGRSLKELAGIPLGDVLFLQQPHEDQVIANNTEVTLKPGSHLHSSPPADYGNLTAGEVGHPGTVEIVSQPGGWIFAILHDYALPAVYKPASVKLLVKLPPHFPDARPDMFWISPPVSANGATPRGTCTEVILGEAWQRFSWHLAPGAWQPGVSELRDFMRCIRARFERQD